MLNPKSVSNVKATADVLLPHGFNCYGGNPGERVRNFEKARDKCQVNILNVTCKEVPFSGGSCLSVYGKQEKDVIVIREMLLSPAFGYIEY
jgi:hypothetical protein